MTTTAHRDGRKAIPGAVTWMAGLALLLGASLAHAQTAARVLFVAGEVTVRGTDEQVRPLGRGEFVESGETVVTGTGGRTQLRFVDGGMVSLRSDTTFLVERFRYEGEDDEQARSFLRLVKGGLRFVTGAVGKRLRSNYRMSTAVATIGIRGSGGNLAFDGNQLTFDVFEGGFVVNTIAGGSFEMGIGQGIEVGIDGTTTGPFLVGQQQRAAPGAAPARRGEAEEDDEDEQEDGERPRPAAPGAGPRTQLQRPAGAAAAPPRARVQDSRAGQVGWGRWTGNVIPSDPQTAGGPAPGQRATLQAKPLPGATLTRPGTVLPGAVTAPGTIAAPGALPRQPAVGPRVGAPAIGGPAVTMPQVSAPRIGGPQVTVPQIGGPQIGVPGTIGPRVVQPAAPLTPGIDPGLR